MAENKPQKGRPQEEEHETLVRIMGQDIKGSKNIHVGLTKVKGVSWAISKIVCHRLNLDKTKKISDLSKEELEQIENALTNLEAPSFMKNRRSDPETGEEQHLMSIKLDMAKEFDIKRMKKIKSYKGVRHTFRLPVRGQRTRSNFRTSGVTMGVKKPKQGKKS